MTAPGPPPVGMDTETDVAAGIAAPTQPDAEPRSPRPAPPSRLSRRARRRRRRRRVLVLVAVVAAGLSIMAVVGPVREGLRGLVPPRGGSLPPDRAASLLLVWPTAEEGGAVIALLGVPPGSSRASALLIPARAQVEVPSFGSQTLAEAFATAGTETLVLALENALDLDVGDVLGLDAATLAAVVEPAAPLDVRLRSPVRVGDDTFPATPLQLGVEDVVRLATTRAEGATELDHLVVVHALLEAWLAELDGDVLGLTQDRLETGLGLDRDRAASLVAVLDDLSRRDVTFDTLDVRSLGLPAEERYAIEVDEVASDMAVLFPGLAFTEDGRRVRVEILNGTGRAGLATEVAARLVPAGAHVVLTGNAAEFGVEETLVVLQDPRREADARRLIEALGTGQLRMARNPLGVADVSIVVGKDFEPGGG